MSVRAIDENNDFTFGKGRNNYKRGLDATNQNLKTRIQSFLGDCFFAQREGIDWFNLLGSKDQNQLSLAIAAVIINTDEVTRMNDFSLSLDRDRRGVSISYNIETVFGRSRNSFQLNLGV